MASTAKQAAIDQRVAELLGLKKPRKELKGVPGRLNVRKDEWQQRDGSIIKLKDMSERHLRNAHSLACQKWSDAEDADNRAACTFWEKQCSKLLEAMDDRGIGY